MDLNEIRLHIKDELIPEPKERGKYVCPICGSGEGGGTHNGAFSIAHDGIHGKCFSCDFYGDIFDLEAAKTGLPLSEATKAVIARYKFSGAAAQNNPPARKEPFREQEAPKQDFSSYLKSCHEALKGSAGEEYLRSRGFTDQTMERFNLGFGQDSLNQPCIVIPYNPQGTYYSTRAIGDNVQQKHLKPKGILAGSEPIFNEAALWQDQPCFVVESQLCAISIMQEGGSAVAVGGTSGKNKILNLKRNPSAPLILCFDNDDRGREAQSVLATGLKEQHIPFIEMNIADDCKDPNELLQKDSFALNVNVSAAITAAQAMMEVIQETEREDYEALTTSASFADFERYLEENAGKPPVPTGFNELDKILNGGLTAGLYIMGAISSLGKTSWMLNIADNISASGRDVLYFSLEMSKYELISKSLSRISFQITGERSLNLGEALTTFGVLHSKGAAAGSSSILPEAMQRYRETIGKHMWIFEGVGNFGVTEITQRVENHIRITGRTPVVFIDYLQILAPIDNHFTDKQNTDKAVVELKRLSATHDLPVFAISSLNRSNYSEPITMAAFKESGAIEYGSDVLIGIQPFGMDFLPGEKQAAHNTRVRNLLSKMLVDPRSEIEVKVLKNRNGSRGGSGKLVFDKKYNSFHEIPEGFTVTKASIFGTDEEEEEEHFTL